MGNHRNAASTPIFDQISQTYERRTAAESLAVAVDDDVEAAATATTGPASEQSPETGANTP
jgi:hypothetical protein